MIGSRNKPPYAETDVIDTLSLELAVFRGDFKVTNYQGARYGVIPAKKNVICEGVILFLQSRDIDIKRFKHKNEDVYLLPIKPLTKYMEYFGDKDKTLTIQSAYVCLYDCFSQLLTRHLSANQFEFNGKLLRIKQKREEAVFLHALFNDQKFKNVVTDTDAGLTINLDFLAAFDLLELDALFAELSAKGERISWKNENFPLCYLAERFNVIPDREDRQVRYLSIDITSAHIDATDEPAIRIPDKFYTSKLLNHFMIMKGYPIAVFNDSVYVFRRNIMQLFPTVHESDFEREAKAFIKLQKQIVDKVCQTKALVCTHFQDTLLICMNRGKNATIGDSAIGSFELKHLTLKSADYLIALCMKLAYIRSLVDLCPDYFNSKFDRRSLIVTSTYGITNKALSQLANKKVVTTSDGNSKTYTIDLLDMRTAERPQLMNLSTEITIMLRQIGARKTFSECIQQAIATDEVTVAIEGLSFILTIPVHLQQLMQPLCEALAVTLHAAQDKYKVTYIVLDTFMSSDKKEPVFAEMAKRCQEQVNAEQERQQALRLAKTAKNKKKKLLQKQRREATLFAETQLKQLEAEIHSHIDYLVKLCAGLDSIFSTIEKLCVDGITIRELLASHKLLPCIRAYGLLMTIEDLSVNRDAVTTEKTFSAETMRILDRCRLAMDEPCTLDNLNDIKALFSIRLNNH